MCYEAKPYGLQMPEESLVDSRLMQQKISKLHWAKQKKKKPRPLAAAKC